MKKKIITALVVCVLLCYQARSQGCVAIRNLTGFTQFSVPKYGAEPVKWMVMVNSRYSEFHDTYNGSTNLNLPPEDQTSSHTVIVDFAVTRLFDNGWSIIVDVPFMAANRTNWQDHSGGT